MASLCLTLGLCYEPSLAVGKTGENGEEKVQLEDLVLPSLVTWGGGRRKVQGDQTEVSRAGQERTSGTGSMRELGVFCTGMFGFCSSPGEGLTLRGPRLGEGFGGDPLALTYVEPTHVTVCCAHRLNPRSGGL